MKQGKILSWVLVVLLVLVAALLVANLLHGGIFVLEGLNGSNGKDGVNGSNGINGTNGANGKSAYDLAVEDGFEGSLHEWLLSLAVRGSDGTNGTNGNGISDVRVDENGYLMVELSNGEILNAGYVGGDGAFSSIPDASGFYEVYETVVMNDTAGGLNLRAEPDIGSESLFVIAPGTELLRVGDQQVENGYSRFLYKGKTCYARSKYFYLKYEHVGSLPPINLPAQLVLTEGEQSWFYTDQILPLCEDGFSVSYSYTGAGVRVYNGGESFGITPAWRNESRAAVHPCEQETLTVSVQVMSDGQMQTVTKKEVRVTVVDRQDSLTLRGILIGDSRISDNAIVDELLKNLPGLELMGTRQTFSSGMMHEGRSSWSTEDYLHSASKIVEGTTVQNAFYNPATGQFDFSYYMQKTGFAAPDFVLFNLGANDNFSMQAVSNLEIMVKSVQAYAASRGITIRVLVLSEYRSPAEGYYLSESANVNVEAKRAKQADYFTYLSEAFDQRESEGVYLIPTHASINAWSDWERESVSTDSGATEERIVDVVHLGRSGYLKEEKMIRAYLYRIFGA